MTPTTLPQPAGPGPGPGRWQRIGAALVRGFHAYANWLVGISWWRFALLSILLLMFTSLLSEMPPFSWTISETVHTEPAAARPPASGASAREPLVHIERAKPRSPGEPGGDIEISIGDRGIRITPRPPSADAAASAAADAAASAASAAAQASSAVAEGVRIVLPPGVTTEEVRRAADEARKEIERAIKEARDDAEQARRDADEAVRDAQAVIDDLGSDEPKVRIKKVQLGDKLPDLALLWILCSIIIKITYKGRMQAEVKAAQAAEVAEAESLKRQVVEARMAAMQAQVEPHFLFNTLASIDHLIETDPPRASLMQKNLIALLRASMPTMREASASAPRDLARELAVIRPYLEILKVRMEERLQTEIDVPEGLMSAEFPPMMIQSLVENAIKHGLEPKPEGGMLTVKAQIVHGKLAVTVADTGLGFGKAATAGTGVGLANIRERLQLIYGAKATLTVADHAPAGTAVTITVPYVARTQDAAA